MSSGWTVEPIRLVQAKSMAEWRYEGDYAFYDSEPGTVDYVMDPTNGYFAFLLGDDFVGFCSLGPDGQVPGGRYDDSAVDVGIGLSPAHVGGGLGRDALAEIIKLAADRYPGMALRATIASFNQRSRRTFERAGFVVEGDFLGPRGRPFHQYRRDPG